jgi:GNAT superfamily N-acetyltransferase
MIDFNYIKKYGQEIETVFDDLAQLRITVFRAFPYLYEGSVEYEKAYLKTYMQSPQSMLFAVYYNGQMVGATTCIPLKDETEEVQAPFKKAGLDINNIFYFGESILLPEMRGKGLGHRFFDEREAHARSFNTYKKTCFCAVFRPENHPFKPENYRTLDAFWLKRGYQKVPTLQSQFEWTDIGETGSTFKPMLYWMRDL